MSDYGDFCREQRERRQALRWHWHECPHCAGRFGTGTKVPPGGRCHHDGWQAPGEVGDDIKAADEREFVVRKIAERKEAKRNRLPPICSCGKKFTTHRALHDHRKDKGHKP